MLVKSLVNSINRINEMNFWFDYDRRVQASYKELLTKLLLKGTNNVYIKEENPFEVFISLLRNFLNKKVSVILDSDFSDREILDLGITSVDISNGSYEQDDFCETFNSIDDIIMFLEENKDDIAIEIYTSGTTGRPKKVTQSYRNLVRAVKKDISYKDNIWGFAYNPTHFAGLQVFFQAFYNKNELVYIFNLDYNKVYRCMLERKVTHLSCTPTYMRVFLNYIDQPITSVRSLTFGGERFSPSIEDKVKNKFPKSKINNIYASTEAGSLLRSDGSYFKIPARYKDLIKIQNDELYIHKTLLGKSASFLLHTDWYKTGDLVEFVDEERFLFKSRKSEMLNVGGYKVNPDEIEFVIRKIKGVKEVSVSGRKNSVMGQIIVANIIKEDGIDNVELKRKIKEVTINELQDFKVPRLIKFVDSFELTRTGKIKKG